MTDRLDDAFRLQQQSLALRGRRQEILSANIANGDTPGYQARDLDFQRALREASGMARVPRLGDVSLARTAPAHIAATGRSLAGSGLLYRQPLQPALDGNTVDMDAERVAFADNTLRYQATATLLTARVRSLLSAVQA